MNAKSRLPSLDIHSYRHARHKVIGMTMEEIAEEDGVKLSTVENSVRDIDARRAIFSLDALEAAQSEVVIFNKELEKMALHESLQAEVRIYGNTPETQGEVVATEPNYEVRLHASEIITEKTKAIISRHVKGASVSTQVNLGIVNASASTNTFEDRLRSVLKKRETPLLVQNDLPASEVLDIAVEEAQPATSGNSA